MAINTQKFLPSSKEKTGETLNVKKSSIVLSQNSVKNIAIIKVKVIQIESILKGTLASEKKSLDQKKRKESAVRREKQEEKLETKTNMGMGGIKMPQRPKLGIFEWIKNFIGNVILGYFAVRLVEHLPKIMPIVKLLGKAGDLIVNFGGKLLNGLVTFIDWGYKAVDFSRGLIGKTFGEDALKNFDKLTSEFEKFMNLAIIVGMASADYGMDRLSGRGKGGKRPRDPGLGPTVRRGAERITTRLGARLGGRGGAKLASKFGPKLLKAVPLLGAGLAITEGIMRIREGDIVGGLLAFGTAIPGFGWGFLALDIAREFMGGQEFDKSVGRALSGKPGLTNKQVQKRTPHFFGPDPVVGAAGGGITRGGKSQGSVKRTVSKGKKGKYKRTLAPLKPGKVEIKTGTDVGQKEKVFDFFGFIKNAIDTINPFNTIKKSGEELGKTDYFGPILAVTSKLTLGQELTQQDYKNVGLGINMLIAKGIQDKQLKGGVIAAFAEGGMVDPDVLSAAQTGGDISNWVAKTFKGEIESNAQRTLRLIKENAEKKKDEPSKEPPSPDINLDGAGTTGGGTADVSLNPYRRAFLDTLAYAEGTANYPNTGYNTMFTGKQFTGYKDHPRKIQVSGRYRSDAAGRYQFLSTTWDGLGLPDFSPANQDKGALKLLAPHVLTAIDKGDFATAFHGARKTWASLPGAGYGQPEKKMKTLVGYANNRLAKYKKGEIGKPIIDNVSMQDLGNVQGYSVTRSGKTIKNYSELPPHHDYTTTSDGRRVQDMTLYKGKEFLNIPVPSPVTGKVTWTGPTSGGGNWVEIQSNDGKVELGHFNKIIAKVGQPVQAFRSVIGLQGHTGRISPPGIDGTHLHIQAPDKVVGRYVNTLSRGAAYAKGGLTLGRPHMSILGEKGKEFVIDADSTAALEKTFPGFLDAVNKARYGDAINVLSNFASYEFGAGQTVVVMGNSTPTTSMGEGYGDSGAVMMMGGTGGGSDPFESLVIGG